VAAKRPDRHGCLQRHASKLGAGCDDVDEQAVDLVASLVNEGRWEERHRRRAGGREGLADCQRPGEFGEDDSVGA